MADIVVKLLNKSFLFHVTCNTYVFFTFERWEADVPLLKPTQELGQKYIFTALRFGITASFLMYFYLF